MANEKKNKKSSGMKASFLGIIIVIAALFGGYSFYWFKVAGLAKESYVSELSKFANEAEISAPNVSGFPGKMIISKSLETLESDKGTLSIRDIRAESWPFPNMPIDIKTGAIELVSGGWLEGLSFDSFDAVMRATNTRVTFEQSALKQKNFSAEVTGSVDISNRNVAIPDLVVSLSNHADLLEVLVNSGIIEEQAAAFVGFGMSALMNQDTQKVDVPVYEKNGMINLGPLPILKLPKAADTATTTKRQKPIVAE